MGGGGLYKIRCFDKSEQFLLSDGVHLNELGNDLFLNNLQGGLEFFCFKKGISLSRRFCVI